MGGSRTDSRCSDWFKQDRVRSIWPCCSWRMASTRLTSQSKWLMTCCHQKSAAKSNTWPKNVVMLATVSVKRLWLMHIFMATKGLSNNKRDCVATSYFVVTQNPHHGDRAIRIRDTFLCIRTFVSLVWMPECLPFSVFVLSRIRAGLAIDRSPFQGVLSQSTDTILTHQ